MSRAEAVVTFELESNIMGFRCSLFPAGPPPLLTDVIIALLALHLSGEQFYQIPSPQSPYLAPVEQSISLLNVFCKLKNVHLNRENFFFF